MQVWCASAANAGHWAFDLRRMVQRRHEIAQFHDTCVENHDTSVTHRVSVGVRRVPPPLPPQNLICKFSTVSVVLVYRILLWCYPYYLDNSLWPCCFYLYVYCIAIFIRNVSRVCSGDFHFHFIIFISCSFSLCVYLAILHLTSILLFIWRFIYCDCLFAFSFIFCCEFIFAFLLLLLFLLQFFYVAFYFLFGIALYFILPIRNKIK